MRRVLLAAAMFAMAASAQAADMPDYLRGPILSGPATVNWRGFYLGGQAGYGSSDENFPPSGVPATLLANISNSYLNQLGVSAPPASGKAASRAPGYGAFAGYNWQWDDVVTGVEMSYLHGSFGGSVSGYRQFSSTTALTDGNYHVANVAATQAFGITDFATFRGRAGYAFGCFLPYAFAGVALGNANISSSISVQDSVGPASGPFTKLAPMNATDLTPNHLIYGYTAGLGMDINLVGGLFMRAEWEYVRFNAVVDPSVNTVRAGLGYKF